MTLPEIKYCPGTLAKGFDTYSRSCCKKLFKGKKVNHILPYNLPNSDSYTDKLFEENQQGLSISGVQEKFSVLLEKNKLRLVGKGEIGEYILKPIPNVGKNRSQMPANEHLTMQIAEQVYGIETAQNALTFFKNGSPAYITKRFDINVNGCKIAQEDFASIAERTPQTHGEHYKYLGNYLDLFLLMKTYVPAYTVEAPKLFKIIVFNYLFSNGDAHFKNFSLIETPMGDFRLSPAYDLLNTHIHIDDKDFALRDGLLPKNLAQGKIRSQFEILAKEAGIIKKVYVDILDIMMDKTDMVEKLVNSSFLNDRTKRNYWQSYKGKLNRLKSIPEKY